MKHAHTVLLGSLIALLVLYGYWFRNEWLAIFVFAVPVAFLTAGVALKRRTAGFWAAVFALFWFSHGIMVAYTRAPERGLAILEIVLALAVVLAASLPGMQSRFNKPKT